ncbi:MAG: transcriptional regulator [Chloroflexota bacterium]|nr:transcriptional regulator [Chloroflexota bacterium]
MPLTRPYEETIKERAQWDPVYRAMMLPSAIDLLLSDDVRVGKIALHSCIYATIGYEKLGALMDKTPDDIKRMCHPDHDTSVNDLFDIIKHIRQHEGIRLEVKGCPSGQDCESVAHDEPAETVAAT